MKKIILSVASAALVAGYATIAMSAASDDTKITITGTAENVCRVGGVAASDPTASAVTNVTSTTLDNDASTLTITDFIVDATAILNDAASTLTYADSYCNYAHSISMSAANGGLDHDGVVTVTGGTFTQHVNYTATATMGSQSNVLTLAESTTAVHGATAVKSTATAVAGANRADLTVAIDIDQSPTDPVLAGVFTDTLCIQIGAAL